MSASPQRLHTAVHSPRVPGRARPNCGVGHAGSELLSASTAVVTQLGFDTQAFRPRGPGAPSAPAARARAPRRPHRADPLLVRRVVVVKGMVSRGEAESKHTLGIGHPLWWDRSSVGTGVAPASPCGLAPVTFVTSVCMVTGLCWTLSELRPRGHAPAALSRSLVGTPPPSS